MTWSLSALEKAFTVLIDQTTIDANHFLLVDDLDEYEGNLATLADMFKKLAKSPSVKVRLASRPWVVLERLPRLRLQDLTADDIRNPAWDNLYKVRRMSWLQEHNPERALCLMKEIVQNADGVFLWVDLVVHTLLEGMANEDSLEDLQNRMRLLPRELTAFYRHMLCLDTPSPYLTQASKVLQLARASDPADLNLSRPPPPFCLLH